MHRAIGQFDRLPPVDLHGSRTAFCRASRTVSLCDVVAELVTGAYTRLPRAELRGQSRQRQTRYRFRKIPRIFQRPVTAHEVGPIGPFSGWAATVRSAANILSVKDLSTRHVRNINPELAALRLTRTTADAAAAQGPGTFHKDPQAPKGCTGAETQPVTSGRARRSGTREALEGASDSVTVSPSKLHGSGAASSATRRAVAAAARSAGRRVPAGTLRTSCCAPAGIGVEPCCRNVPSACRPGDRAAGSSSGAREAATSGRLARRTRSSAGWRGGLPRAGAARRVGRDEPHTTSRRPSTAAADHAAGTGERAPVVVTRVGAAGPGDASRTTF
jgi:hypothetical protein